jgi:hypothetical protein
MFMNQVKTRNENIVVQELNNEVITHGQKINPIFEVKTQKKSGLSQMSNSHSQQELLCKLQNKISRRIFSQLV